MRALRLIAMLLATFAAARASAHGGVPVSTGVQFASPAGRSVVAYETTFGLLMPDAEGAWRVTCEETKEPGIKLFKVWPDGEVGMGYSGGYLYSDDGCSFAQASGVAASARTLQSADLGGGLPAALVLLTDLDDGQQLGTNLFVSNDRGRSFRQLPFAKEYNLLSMVVSQTDPPEIVLTADIVIALRPDGSADRERWLLRSSKCLTDAACVAADWSAQLLDEPQTITGTTKVLALMPEGLFLRNVTGQDSKLLRSVDGGATIETVLPSATQELPNPVEFLTRVGDDDLWISAGAQQTFHSVDGGRTWERRPDMGDIRCLGRDGSGLHGCVVDSAQNAVASSSSDGGRTWQLALRYSDIAGIRQCPANSDVGVACDSLWPLIELAFKGTVTPAPAPAQPGKPSGCASVNGALGALVVAFMFRFRTRRRSMDA